MRRSLVRVLVTVVALAVILVAADLGARRYVVGRVADEVQQEYGLDERPDVALAGGSFLLQALRGRFEDVTLHVDELPTDTLTLSDVDVVVPEVAVPRGVVFGGSGTVDLSAGTIRALVDFASLQDQVTAQSPVPVTLERADGDIRARTTVSVLGLDLDLALTVEPRLEDGEVDLVPVAAALGDREVSLSRARQLASAVGLDVLDGWTVALDDVPGEVQVQSLTVVQEGIAVRGALLATSVDVD